MKTQYYTASSLDGFIADRNNSLDWLMQFDVEESSYPAFIQDVGAIAMGSTTYEWILNHQTEVGAGEEEAWPYEQPAWVFTSRELPRFGKGDVRFVRGDVRPVHQQMAAAANGKNIWIAGGGDLAGQFYDHDLLDEIIVQIAAVTLGAGAPISPGSSTLRHCS